VNVELTVSGAHLVNLASKDLQAFQDPQASSEKKHERQIVVDTIS
jgi:hypothetical protein